MKTKRRFFRSILLSLVLAALLPQASAVNEGMWMGLTYSVSLKYVETEERGIDAPVPKTVQMPAYPQKLMWAAVSGEVVVLVNVDKDGAVRSVKVESATADEFGSAASDAASLWKFFPGTNRKTHSPIPVTMKCKFVFRAVE